MAYFRTLGEKNLTLDECLSQIGDDEVAIGLYRGGIVFVAKITDATMGDLLELDGQEQELALLRVVNQMTRRPRLQ